MLIYYHNMLRCGMSKPNRKTVIVCLVSNCDDGTWNHIRSIQRRTLVEIAFRVLSGHIKKECKTQSGNKLRAGC